VRADLNEEANLSEVELGVADEEEEGEWKEIDEVEVAELGGVRDEVNFLPKLKGFRRFSCPAAVVVVEELEVELLLILVELELEDDASSSSSVVAVVVGRG
jgi:hypothetical protein